jgi:hypothetical protein
MDVTLNEDKLCNRYPEYNTDLWLPGSLKRTVVAGTAEPVTVAEAKTYLKINYNSSDTSIALLIIAARQWCEAKIAQSIILTDVEVTIQVVQFVELPYGPIEDPTEITGIGQDYIQKGTFPTVSGTQGRFDVKYRAGYTQVPEWAKLAILARVAATFENVGDQDKTNYSQVARTHLAGHKRIASWL